MHFLVKAFVDVISICLQGKYIVLYMKQHSYICAVTELTCLFGVSSDDEEHIAMCLDGSMF
jgi:hypothetical protein